MYTRREFLGTTVAGLGGILCSNSLLADEKEAAYFDPYKKIRIGKTSVETTRLSMGTGIKGWNKQSNLTRLGYDNGVALVRRIYDKGVRMFDTADLYGTHQMVGDALRIHPRESYTLFTKIGHQEDASDKRWSDEYPDIEAMVVRIMKEYKTDYIDGVQLHCMTASGWNTKMSDYMEILDRLKQKGVIRIHGLSCHGLPAIETAIHEPWVDSIHVRFNAYGNKMDDTVEKIASAVQQLHQAGKGVIAMKVFGEGELAGSDEKKDNSLRFVLQSGNVDVVNIGMDKMSDILDTEERIRRVKRITA
ncbi:MAG: aldo/keto reductase [Tannerella sp.]|jgi:aryl-alcohol dehydrogenase-like predicted oxidoreductase|nr:aldo/keto reductase [Tannerella sp.]